MPGTRAVPVPPNAVLLHIGPHKTGTTALQGAFHKGRATLAAHGVHYPGPERSPGLAILAVTGRPPRRGDPHPQRAAWDALVADVAAHADQRVVVSSERFASAPPDRIRPIVEDLDPARVHVVITLRPLARILPSQYQQYVQNALTTPYPQWLRRTFNRPPGSRPSPDFWVRHAHDQLVRRWADVVGAERVTVVALDDADRSSLPHAFEQLLDLPPDTLRLGISNRSLSAGEIEALRLLNKEFKERQWPQSLYGRYARDAFVNRVRLRPLHPDEPRLVTPAWALERAQERSAAAVDAIRRSGVNVIGDLSLLCRPEPPERVGRPPEDPPVPASAVARALVGTIVVGRDTRWPRTPEREVAHLSTRALLRIVVRRVARRLRPRRS